MNPKLEIKYLKLEKSRNRLFDELDGLEGEMLNTPPAEGKWSINQIIAHLMLVEKLSVDYIQHKIEKKQPLPLSSFSNSCKSLLMKAVLQSGIKFKAPESVASVPATATLSSLRNQWDEERFRLEDVLTDLPHNLFDKCLFKHPYAGPLSITQTLIFFQDHFNHHLRQIQHQKQVLLKQTD
ncbi:DinB family protein [Pontibacter silvestris]|uniref:DinB family protein n=1 Tax=Pontibacter silvestris TaxID=2305183 RepID=A0ABW4WV91_9BACT|nr:DinB family protein [Pontibacter silvestris]MCC9137772.1 DinB family protein [Pontibacter silvestris]